MAVNPSGGNVYVADTGNDRIQEFSAGGTFFRTWGLFGSEDGNFKAPKGIAIDGSGHVWVADSGNNRIQEFSATGSFLAKWGSSGSGDGPTTTGRNRKHRRGAHHDDREDPRARARMMRARGIQSVRSPWTRWPTTSTGLQVPGPSRPLTRSAGNPCSI